MEARNEILSNQIAVESGPQSDKAKNELSRLDIGPPMLSLQGITKAFPGVIANSHVTSESKMSQLVYPILKHPRL